MRLSLRPYVTLSSIKPKNSHLSHTAKCGMSMSSFSISTAFLLDTAFDFDSYRACD